MKEHLKRRAEYTFGALPEEGTPEYENVIKQLQLRESPQLKKEIKKKHNEAVKTWELQAFNGIGLTMDPEIRHYLGEFNYRSWNYGHRKMPIMFNVMEAFFNLDKRLNYWTLLDEEDYSISFFDFIDFYTSNEFQINIDELKLSLEEDLIYNFNVGYDLKKITFKTDEGNEFVIAGVSMVRRGNEVTMLFVSGEITDTSEKSKQLTPLSEINRSKGKEKIKISDQVREAVKLNDDENLWKTLIACRFDLDSKTIDARYVAYDEGNSFSIFTDDVTGFMKNGDWTNTEYEETFKNLVSKVEKYNSIFELAKACLFLPNYFDAFESEIEEQDFDTEAKTILKNPFKKREFTEVDNKFKIRNRPLWVLFRDKTFSFDRIKLKDENFKIETSGYWKKLNDYEIGSDKNGNSVSGKTWVKRTESYFVGSEEELIIEGNKKSNFTTKNAGKIYVMRNANFGENIYKIGLTTKTTEERARQLSKTSVPDRFQVMREWDVKDCYLAEKSIHKTLEKYRLDKSREFFQVDMKLANNVIDAVVDEINKNNDA